MSTKVKFPSSNSKGDCHGVLRGDVTKSTKGLIVLQEWWGMNQQIQDEATEIGEMGNFVTLVPDLYRGLLATDNEAANHLMSNLDWPGAIKDIEAAAKFLLRIGCTKVGVTGFCMGGALAMASAALVKEISAAAPFYGIPGDQLVDVTKIKVPLQCHFGAKDEVKGFSSPEDQATLRNKLNRGGVKYEFYTYNAGHAFTNKEGPNYNEAACKEGIGRLVQFMNKHL